MGTPASSVVLVRGSVFTITTGSASHIEDMTFKTLGRYPCNRPLSCLLQSNAKQQFSELVQCEYKNPC